MRFCEEGNNTAEDDLTCSMTSFRNLQETAGDGSLSALRQNHSPRLPQLQFGLTVRQSDIDKKAPLKIREGTLFKSSAKRTIFTTETRNHDNKKSIPNSNRYNLIS
ncbi:MAG: hypothetical protein C0616_01875 [Desulfuromonas sp.]|nr:MAG: hypothetical protein C0616_01875 [Desulfuromonas sp.]